MANAAAKSTPETPTESERVFAKYHGMPGIVSARVMSKADLKNVGVIVQEDVVFDARNRFVLDVTEAPDGLLDLLKEDPDISLSSSPAAPKVTEIVAGVSGPNDVYSGSPGTVAGATTA